MCGIIGIASNKSVATNINTIIKKSWNIEVMTQQVLPQL